MAIPVGQAVWASPVPASSIFHVFLPAGISMCMKWLVCMTVRGLKARKVLDNVKCCALLSRVNSR